MWHMGTLVEWVVVHGNAIHLDWQYKAHLQTSKKDLWFSVPWCRNINHLRNLVHQQKNNIFLSHVLHGQLIQNSYICLVTHSKNLNLTHINVVLNAFINTTCIYIFCIALKQVLLINWIQYILTIQILYLRFRDLIVRLWIT